jgi:hypothetical protein
VDSLLSVSRLPESALAEVARIDTLAMQEHNSAQEVKALIYRLTIRQQKNENDDTAGIRSMEKRLLGAAQPERSILESLLARLYWSYLQRNRVKLYNRTATVTHGDADLTTWTTADFQRRISDLYRASVKEEGLLERTEPAKWEPVVIKGNSPRLRPTLYDILAHEALGYFGSPAATIDQPNDAYEIDDTAVFADATVFARHVFQGMDTTSPHDQALLLYQRLIRLHLADAQPDALVDVDIERLMFARSFSSDPEKDFKFQGALARLTDRCGDLPAVAQAWYLQAQHYYDGAAADRMVRAKAICERVLREPDSSEGKANCRKLLADIFRQSLDLQAEQFNLPGKPFRCLVKWSNLNRIYFRLVKIDSAMWKKERTVQDYNYWKDWLPAPVYRSFSQGLPDSADYLTHTVEIPVGSLPPGSYALLATADSSWNTRNGVILGQHIYVTSIAYLRNGGDYFVVNRESGQPLNDTRVQVWNRHWDNVERTWQLSEAETYHTDQQGHF